MSNGAYHPKSLQHESRYEEVIISARASVSNKSVSSSIPNKMVSMADAFSNINL